MTGLFLVGLLTLFVLVVVTGMWLVMSALAEPPEDTQGRVSKPLASRNSRSWFGRLKGWLNHAPPKLYYRRDKRGRFRKVWRG